MEICTDSAQKPADYKAEIEVVPVGRSVDEEGQEQFIGTVERKIEGGLRFEAVSDGLEVRVILDGRRASLPPMAWKLL